MRVRVLEANIIEIILSKRNLLALLTKLEREESKKTIMTNNFYDGEGNEIDGMVVVTAEKDDVHYEGREPGPMHPETEKDMQGTRELRAVIDSYWVDQK